MLENMHTNSIEICLVAEDGVHIFDNWFVVQIPNDKTFNVMQLILLNVIPTTINVVALIFNIDLVNLFELICFNRLGKPQSSESIPHFGYQLNVLFHGDCGAILFVL